MARIVDAFYERVVRDPELRPIFPRDLCPGREKQKLFLEQWLGGAERYSERNGPAMLRRRHSPFVISERAAERWLHHMTEALRECDVPPDVASEMLAGLGPLARRMVNEGERMYRSSLRTRRGQTSERQCRSAGSPGPRWPRSPSAEGDSKPSWGWLFLADSRLGDDLHALNGALDGSTDPHGGSLADLAGRLDGAGRRGRCGLFHVHGGVPRGLDGAFDGTQRGGRDVSAHGRRLTHRGAARLTDGLQRFSARLGRAANRANDRAFGCVPDRGSHLAGRLDGRLHGFGRGLGRLPADVADGVDGAPDGPHGDTPRGAAGFTGLLDCGLHGRGHRLDGGLRDLAGAAEHADDAVLDSRPNRLLVDHATHPTPIFQGPHVRRGRRARQHADPAAHRPHGRREPARRPLADGRQRFICTRDPPTFLVRRLAFGARTATRDDTGRMHAEPRYWWHWWAVNARWWWSDVRTLVRETVREFGADQCPQLAAGISYYVLFSIFPLALLFLAISGLVLANESLRGLRQISGRARGSLV